MIEPLILERKNNILTRVELLYAFAMRYHVLDSHTAYTAHMTVCGKGMIKAFTLTNLIKIPQLGIVVRKNIITKQSYPKIIDSMN